MQRPNRDIRDYADIINLPHHISERHPPMSLRDRAGQFAPFSALTGLHAAADRAAARSDAAFDAPREIDEPC
ncbi:hypothetical protein [Selenomonas sp. F0473]|uniref:hypothetical protein n=1 Tax=Selenomonas sp. F0473 TaxID=999423 RepID=UPI00029EA96E|nr:hypothetical protein [Selenomonas sp. F0473]EKU70437.1 hypothetical protein HMPREF9161_01867 [Selenomonas sp. F0473]